MSAYSQRQSSDTQQAQQQTPASEGAELGYDSQEQCALPEGCDADIPTLDEIFGDGFVDEHGGLLGDITQVTSLAMQLQGEIPVAAHGAKLDHHIDGLFFLDEELARAIETAQAGAAYVDDAVEFDEAAVARVDELWYRIEVGLDLLREHNGLYQAVNAQDLGGQLEQLARLGADVIDASMQKSMDEAEAEAQARLEAFDAAWKQAALAVAKLPVDIALDAAAAAAVSAGVPAVMGAVAGTGAAVASGVAIAAAVSVGGAALTSTWGSDVNDLHQGIGGLNRGINIAATGSAIDQVGEGLKKAATEVSGMTTRLSVFLDAAQAGVAIDGMYDAWAAWQAFMTEHDKLQAVWSDATALLGGLLGFADQLKAGITELEGVVGQHCSSIAALESEFGEELYSV